MRSTFLSNKNSFNLRIYYKKYHSKAINLFNDSEVRNYMNPDVFLKSKEYTGLTNSKLKNWEYNWGNNKLIQYKLISSNKYIPYWSGLFGEYYALGGLLSQHKNVGCPVYLSHLKPDWECDNYIYEVKMRTYASKGSIGEKILGTPLKYADLPEIYNKPLKIILLGNQEYEAQHKFKIINCDISDEKKIILDFLKNLNITYEAGSNL